MSSRAGVTNQIIDELHAAASATAATPDFGGDDHLVGLATLVDELVARSGDVDVARQAAAGLSGALLGERLASQEQWRAHPEVLSTDVPAPLFIVGVPRTGTTALHHLLSVDPQFQVMEHWILHAPMPRPPRSQWDREPGYRRAVAAYEHTPDAVRAFHHVEPGDADECLTLMAQTFVSNLFGSRALIPGYDEWFLDADMTPSFARYADQLRLVGKDDSRRWLLKNPSHLLSLPELFAVFPNAQVVQTHRDPALSIGSVVSLLTTLAGEEPGPRADRELHMWGEAVRRADAFRAGGDARCMDVDYEEFTADPLGTVAAIYHRFGIALDDTTRAAQREWVLQHPQGQHGLHSYDPAELGVTQEKVAAHFGAEADRHVRIR